MSPHSSTRSRLPYWTVVTLDRTEMSATATAMAATEPPTHRQWTAHASTAPTTQNPGSVACRDGPLTSGDTRIAASATSRSRTSRGAPRRSGLPYAHTATPVHTARAARTRIAVVTWSVFDHGPL